MKKSSPKLALRPETVRTLASLELARVAGGEATTTFTTAKVCPGQAPDGANLFPKA